MNISYLFCKKCGKPHDDGTAEFCFDCLDMLSAPEDVQELTDPRCVNCNSSDLYFRDWNTLVCKKCGMFQDNSMIDLMLSLDLPRHGCFNCKYSAYLNDDVNQRLFCNNINSYNCDNFVSIDICGLYEEEVIEHEPGELSF